jgi:DNA-binding XRE family transcriptional regulator
VANRLKMAIVSSILTLRKRGWSQRKIARELGVSRTTVRRHLAGNGPDPNCTTNPPPGSEVPSNWADSHPKCNIAMMEHLGGRPVVETLSGTIV